MSHDFNRKGIKDIMTEEVYLNHPIILLKSKSGYTECEPVQLSGQKCLSGLLSFPM